MSSDITLKPTTTGPGPLVKRALRPGAAPLPSWVVNRPLVAEGWRGTTITKRQRRVRSQLNEETLLDSTIFPGSSGSSVLSKGEDACQIMGITSYVSLSMRLDQEGTYMRCVLTIRQMGDHHPYTDNNLRTSDLKGYFKGGARLVRTQNNSKYTSIPRLHWRCLSWLLWG